MLELKEQTLVEVLAAASNSLESNSYTQNAAENQLKSWESQKGYHYLLQSVYINKNLNLQVRWLAVILLKNGIEKYWRPTRINSITFEEKIEIRKRLFDNLDELNNQLTVQNAYLISKISRVDFPTQWPDLFESIISILNSLNDLNLNSNLVKLNNLMIILNQVIKILSSVRIGKAKISMQSKSSNLLPYLIKFYTNLFNQWLQNINSIENNELSISSINYLILKNIRRVIVDAFNNQNREKIIQDFMELSLQHFQKLILLDNESVNSNGNDLILRNYIKCLIKLYYNLSSNHTCSFVLLSSSKNILLTLLSLLQQKSNLIYNANDEDDDFEITDFWEKLAIKSVLIMKNITNFTFNSNTTLIKQKNDKLENDNAIIFMKTHFFNNDLIGNLFDLLLNNYLKLRPVDLNNWKDDPEDWFIEENSVNYEFQIRKCSENYFQDLTIHFKDFFINFAVNNLKLLNQSSNSTTDILTKDAIYSIFQLGYDSIKANPSFNFNDLLINYLLPEINNSKSNNNNSILIERRFFLIINEWIDILDLNTRDEIYKFIIETTINSNDLVVKLTCINTLKNLIDDWEFRKINFKPYCNKSIELIINLLNLLNLVESKKFVLNCLSILIERNTPLIDEEILIRIVSITPILWEDSNNNSNNSILKNSILRLLKDLTYSLNEKSFKIYDIVLPLIPICCDSSSEFYSLLCEDGLELWLAILKTSENLENIKILFNDNFMKMLINCLNNWTEILNLILNIIKSYSILSVSIFNGNLGLEILTIIKSYLKNMRDDNLFLSSSILEICLINNENNENKLLFLNNLIESGLFTESVNYIIRETDSPFCEIKMSIPILRLMIENTEIFTKFLNPFTIHLLIKTILNFFGKTVIDVKYKKLILLGLLSFYKSDLLINSYSNNLIINSNVSLPDIEYEINQLECKVGISTILLMNVNQLLKECWIFLEQINESPSGDLPIYHKFSTLDDEDLKELGKEDEEAQEEGIQDNEYYKNTVKPPSAERVRFWMFRNTKKYDLIHYMPFKVYISNVLQDIGQFIIDSGVVENSTIEELQLVLK